MSRTYYTDFIRHSLRFYTRNYLTRPSFKSDADKRNWIACDMVLKKLPKDLQTILIEIYSGHDTLADEVYGASKKWGVEQNKLWDLMKATETKIANKRGLI